MNPSLAETIAFLRALEASVARLETAVDGPRPVVLATYGDTQRHPGSTPLLALLLRRYGVPVLIHGPGGGDASTVEDSQDETSEASRRGVAVARSGTLDEAPQAGAAAVRCTTLEILLELGIEPAHGVADAQRIFAQHRIAYVPDALLAPGLAALLACGARLGGGLLAHALASLIDPFAGDGFRVVDVSCPEQWEPMRELLIATRARALLLPAMAGESIAHAQHPLQIETFSGGVGTVCAEKETCQPDDNGTALPGADNAPAIAAWITEVLAGSVPVPASIITQLACCLQGTRRPVVAG